MTDEAMSPLRRRMIEDVTIRKLSPKTQQGYIRTIKDFAAFLGRSPGTGELRGRTTLSAAPGGERRAPGPSSGTRYTARCQTPSPWVGLGSPRWRLMPSRSVCYGPIEAVTPTCDRHGYAAAMTCSEILPFCLPP